MRKFILTNVICLFTAISSFAQGFFEDFEGDVSAWKFVNGNQTNQWVISSGTSYEGSKSAYISEDGNTYTYFNTNVASVVHLYRDITIVDDGLNVLSFYYKEGGYANMDDMKVYLIPSSITPTAGSQLSNDYLLGTFSVDDSWIKGNLDLSVYTGAKRLVFSWRNARWTGGMTPRLPVAIDNVRQIKASSGNGTEQNPYLISSKADMEVLATVVNCGNTCSGKYFLLTRDLTGANDTVTTVIGNFYNRFNGIFDGGGHVIGLKIDNSSIGGYGYSGVFGRISGATIKNLGVTGSSSFSTSQATIFYLGGICGWANDNSTISNCYNNMVCFSLLSDNNSRYFGGICGYAFNTTFANCYNAADFNHFTQSGGICGNATDCTISNCYNSANSNSSRFSGGICGVGNTTTIYNCYNTGNISADSNNSSASSGGISGGGTPTIINCYSTGNISAFNSSTSGTASSGGICGTANSFSKDNTKISNCFAANSSITASTPRETNIHVGRIVGENSMLYEGNTIEACYALSSTTLNGSAVSSQDLTNTNGKDASLANFQSQSWIANALQWDFNTVWKMSDINSANQGLPILVPQFLTAIPVIQADNEPLRNIRYFDLQGRALPQAPIGKIFIESGENSSGKIISRKKFVF